MVFQAAVVGASGYAGGEVVRLLDEHPAIEIAYLGAHSQAGSRLSSAHPQLNGGGRPFGPNDADAVPDVEIAFLGLPHGASTATGLALVGRGIKVVDMGSDFRMDTPERYEDAYGTPHPRPSALTDWVYGLPEFFRERMAGADAVASPGCYPTAALLAVVPLLAGGLIDPAGIVINALSGVSGAGRSGKEELMFGAVDEGVRAYGVASHRHRPEIEMGIALAAQRDAAVTFTPHLVPMQRGILATSTARATDGVTGGDLSAALSDFYENEPFVDVIDDPPQTRWVVGSNKALVAAFVDERTGTAIVMSAIDNLIKGAAGQAVQAANLMLGLPETDGLPTSGWMP